MQFKRNFNTDFMYISRVSNYNNGPVNNHRNNYFYTDNNIFIHWNCYTNNYSSIDDNRYHAADYNSDNAVDDYRNHTTDYNRNNPVDLHRHYHSAHYNWNNSVYDNRYHPAHHN